LLYEFWTKIPEWAVTDRPDYWLLKLDWADVQWLAAAFPGAALLGWLIEFVWIRIRLLWVLRGLWRRIAH